MNYKELVDEFGKEKILQRYETIYDSMDNYLARKEYKDVTSISRSLLDQAIVDYFTDISRMKSFHGITYANYIKIHAYTAYWLLRRKPIQVLDDTVPELRFINESFIVSYLMHFLHKEDKNLYVSEQYREDYSEFVSNLEYTLRYRNVTAKMIETFLEAFNAGRAVEKSV